MAGAAAEISRVTAPGGRVVIVEPDNAARYTYSSLPSGGRAFAEAARFFAALAAARAEATDPSIGPKMAMMMADARIEPLAVRLFPVSHVQLGCPRDEVWAARRARVEQTLSSSPARGGACQR